MFQQGMPAAADHPGQSNHYLIVDDHPMVRESLHTMLQTLDPMATTDLAISVDDMRRLFAAGHRYRYGILDLTLPDGNGVEVIQAARDCQPDLPLIVFTGRQEQELVLQSLSLGAVGFIPKTHYNDQIQQALRTIIAGQVYVPKQAVADSAIPSHYTAMRPVRQVASDPTQLCLTERQIDVLDLILKGMPNKLICRELDLAEGTVKVHVSAVLRALGVRNRTQAVIAASKMGLRIDRKRRSSLAVQPGG